jgi:hypothetical protein
MFWKMKKSYNHKTGTGYVLSNREKQFNFITVWKTMKINPSKSFESISMINIQQLICRLLNLVLSGY